MTSQIASVAMNNGTIEQRASTAAPLPANETGRINALYDLHILDTDHDERFDRIARLVKAHFGMPVVRISFVDTDRTWFKACIGLNARQAPRNISICAHTILKEDVLVCHDLTAHPVFKASPKVTGPPSFRFYAGAPIELANGFNVGSVCLMDYEPRIEFDDRDEAILKDFAGIIVHELELHRQIAEGGAALSSAKNAAARSAATQAQMADFLTTGLKQPLNAIHDYSSLLIKNLESSRTDCAGLAETIKDTTAGLVNKVQQFASEHSESKPH
jgi:hypothetical protein